MKTEKQNVQMWMKTMAILGFVTWVITSFFHGMMGTQSYMMSMMFGSNYMFGMMTSVYSLLIFVIAGAFYGWLFATLWNWIAKWK
ncbi:MAG TPA: hypothetical protein VJH34_00455 [archaeon]|nr:hypothetical protein [archaeon]